MAKILLVLFFYLSPLTTIASCHEMNSGTFLRPNHFNFRNFYNWDLVKNHLESSGQKNTKVSYLDLAKVRSLYTTNGFDVYEEVQELYKLRKGVLKSINSLVPSINIRVSADSLPSSFNSFVSGLLSFLLPSNWFSWLEAKQFYNARRYTFLNTILDKYSLAEVLYYNIHLIKSDFELASFF